MFIDIMMNVGHHLLCGARTRRPAPARYRAAALPHHAARSGARRRLDGARRHIRSGDRRVPAADHAAGLSRRFLLVARAGLGAVRLCELRTNTAAIRAFCKLPKLAPITTSRTRRPMACRRGISTRPLENRTLLDTSAAAIAAAGLLRLCRLSARSDEGPLLLVDGDPHPAHALREATWRSKTAKWEGILKGGVYHIHKGLGVDESVMWGEYFFMEALEQALRVMGDNGVGHRTPQLSTVKA